MPWRLVTAAFKTHGLRPCATRGFVDTLECAGATVADPALTSTYVSFVFRKIITDTGCSAVVPHER